MNNKDRLIAVLIIEIVNGFITDKSLLFSLRSHLFGANEAVYTLIYYS